MLLLFTIIIICVTIRAYYNLIVMKETIMKITKSIVAMALAVASFVPVANVGATSSGDYEIIGKIDSVNVTITPPTIGSKVGVKTCTETYENGESYSWDCPDTKPVVSVPSDANYTVESYTAYVSGFPSRSATYDEWYIGTFEADTDYYIEVGLSPKSGYEFNITGSYDFDLDKYVITDNVKPTITGVEEYEVNDQNFSSQYMFYARVRAVEGGASSSEETTEAETASVETNTTVYETLNGEGQTFYTASDSGLSFRFDMDYYEFLDSGKVYMDDELVDSSNYTVKSGSTIVTFNDSYVGTLGAGAHTVKVATANGEAYATFTLKKSANPKTGLNVAGSAVLFIVSLATLAGAAIYATKASKA